MQSSRFFRFHRLMSTVNPKEAEKFRTLDWWGPDSRPLQSMNRLRVPWIKENSGFTPGQTRILDVGCGGGILSEPLARLKGRVTGLDVVEENVRLASARITPELEGNLSYVHSTLEDFDAEHKGDKFDVVVASEVLEHVDNPGSFISHCSSLLKDSGSLFITTLNRTTASWLIAICGAEYALRLLPRGTHDWNKFLKPEEVEEAMKAAGLRVISVNGLTYIPYWDKWMWIPDTSVNYGIHAIKES
eukprot:TRINITY_DN5429_c0_g1_i1.p1 TRINITY_DN5429_c0_g1~~TRINITY_DN5429_c0_g1_i1.p1  ORF type:complete len:245 (-),score=70.16 TRINITY_DN5429_c0_g1_i1:95-829(-)